MNLRDFLQEINDEVKTLVSPEFDVQVGETNVVPNVNDSGITFDNFDSKSKRCKIIETCVLYIDIRNSTQLNLYHRPQTLAKLYSSFVRSMVKAAGFYGGYVRNIIGDRVMVIFDKENCFVNAVNTAILLNTIAGYILNKHFRNNDVRCGIGIDFGKMLVVKTGTIKMGKENPIYKSLVWLGKPANIASKLTDEANKTMIDKGVSAGYYYPALNEWFWIDVEYSEFLEKLQPTFSPILKHKDQHFSTFFQTSINSTNSTPAILITSEVFEGFRRKAPNAPSIINNWWRKQSISVQEYSGDIYGADVYYLVIEEIK